MKRVYLDNGSTSFPKAPGVSDAVKNFMDNVGTNVNRGGYEEAYAAEDIIIETREKLCKLFHFDKLRNVIFTPSITYSLNYIIKGYLRPGDHVLVSSMEHNAMMRPLQQVKQLGVEFDRIPCTPRWRADGGQDRRNDPPKHQGNHDAARFQRLRYRYAASGSGRYLPQTQSQIHCGCCTDSRFLSY